MNQLDGAKLVEPSGFLRNGVSVRWSDEAVTLRFGLWSTSLPRDWVNSTLGFAEFLARKVSAGEFLERSKELESVLILLDAQQCLSAEEGRSCFTLREVRELFLPLCMQAYGRYYSHPLWDALRSGTLPRNGFIAWIVHNYHLSRSAGATAARGAVFADRDDVRATFLQSALEEYSHCQDYYFVRHPGLRLPDEEIKTFVSLPSDTAFDQQMFRMAEDDWLGHTLVALFQEMTASYAEQCSDFFRQVEASYDLPGFFKRWEAHIAFDGEHEHAGSFESLLASDETWPAEAVFGSLRNAWFTMEFLTGALDEIVAQGARGTEPPHRRPISGGVCNPSATALFHGPDWDGRPAVRLEAASAAKLLDVMRASVLPAHRLGTPVPDEDLDFMRAELSESILRALGYARSHGEVLLYGRLTELAGPSPPRLPLAPRSPYCAAIGNFLREAARQPSALALLLQHALEAGDGSPAEEDWLVPGVARARRLLADFLEQPSSQGELDQLATLLLRFDEILGAWFRSRGSAPVIDFLRQ